MKFILTLSLLLLLALAFWPVAAVAGDSPPPVLVTSSWVAEHLNDRDLVILNVSQSRRDYQRGHIPGARFIWTGSVAASNQELNFELLPVEHLDTLLEGLGISNSSRIILCGVNGNISATARVFITLEYLGMGERTSILDGGFDAWKSEGRPVSTESAHYARSSFSPQLKKDAIVDANFVKAKLHMPGIAIVDARAQQYYNGIGGGSPRAGHIPGARNLFFATLVDSVNKYLPVDSLKAKFALAGIQPGDELITYCHTGQTASTVYLAAKQLGYSVHLYDGSFEDWSSRDDLPVEVPKK